MTVIIIVAAVIVVLFFMTHPEMSEERRRRLAPFEAVPIAHRGFFDNSSEAPENTLAAFRAAADAGYGIEMDVRLAKDRRLVVAHDPDLKRIAGIKRKIRDMTAEELASVSVFGSRQGVPLFADALKAAGNVPLIVEIKAENLKDELETCRLAARLIADYPGPVAVQSFSPLAMWWFRKNRPDILRGQLSMNHFAQKRRAKKKDVAGAPLGFLLTNLLLNFLSRPDFVAYDFLDRGAPALWLQKHLYGTKLAAWTIKNEADMAEARRMFDIIIFDSFSPEEDIG